MSLNNEIDDILREFAQAQGIKKKELFRSRYTKKPKKKREYPKYIRSARLHETNAKTRSYSMFTALTEERIEPYHRESLIHCTLDEAPRCYCCGALPTTLGDLIYSLFTMIYKCNSCDSVYPHYFSIREFFRNKTK